MLAEPVLAGFAALEPLLQAWHEAGGRRSLGDFVVKSGRDTVQQWLAAGAG